MTDSNDKQTSVEEPDWGQLFHDPVIDVKHSSKGYANDVWIVSTEKSTYVVKATREPPNPTRPFWNGILTLFGMNVYDHMPRRRHLVAFLSRHTSLVIPQALHIDLSQKVFQRPFVVYEKLPGKSPVSPFGSPVIARELGEHLGRVHAANFRFWGSYPPPPEFALHDWPPRLASSLEKLAPRAFSDQPAVIEALPGFVAQARRLSPPSSASLILPDLRPNQFLVRDGHLFALVDIESHVLGPRELDFVALEYSLSQDDLEAFTDGYTHHLALPDLGAVRQLYRYFYWVIKAIGSDNYKQWMEHLTLF